MEAKRQDCAFPAVRPHVSSHFDTIYQWVEKVELFLFLIKCRTIKLYGGSGGTPRTRNTGTR